MVKKQTKRKNQSANNDKKLCAIEKKNYVLASELDTMT